MICVLFVLEQKETIEHVLYECEKVQRFLSTVATWFFEFFTFNNVTEKKAFIFGCSESEFINTINYLLKYYIYSSQCKDNQLLLTKFQIYGRRYIILKET